MIIHQDIGGRHGDGSTTECQGQVARFTLIGDNDYPSLLR